MKTALLLVLATLGVSASALEPPTQDQAILAAFTGLSQVCAEVYPKQALGIASKLERMVQEVYGEGAQAQQKYQIFLLRDDIKEFLQIMLQDNRSRIGDATFGWEQGCQPSSTDKK
jgi:predicted RNase H-like nuclease